MWFAMLAVVSLSLVAMPGVNADHQGSGSQETVNYIGASNILGNMGHDPMADQVGIPVICMNWLTGGNFGNYDGGGACRIPLEHMQEEAYCSSYWGLCVYIFTIKSDDVVLQGPSPNPGFQYRCHYPNHEPSGEWSDWYSGNGARWGNVNHVFLPSDGSCAYVTISLGINPDTSHTGTITIEPEPQPPGSHY